MAKKKRSKRKKPTPKKAHALENPLPQTPAMKRTTISYNRNQADDENKRVLPNPSSDEVTLQGLIRAVHVDIIVDRIWNTYFSAAERRRIIADNFKEQRIADGDSMWPNIVDSWAKSKIVFDIVAIWARFKGVSRKKAILSSSKNCSYRCLATSR